MCLFRVKAGLPKGEPRQEYGVLLHNMTEASYYGTCLMSDGRYITISWDKLHQAFKRIKEWDSIIPPKKEKELRAVYIGACADTTALDLRVEQSQAEYKDGIERVRLKREAARAAAAALKNKKTPSTKATKKAKISDICVNTHVSMFFRWEELESPLPRPSKVPDADGKIDLDDQWVTGTVTAITQNKFRKKVYTCVFDTPGKYTSPYNAQEILVARDNYVKLKKSYHGIVDSSSDDFSATDDDSNVPPMANAAPPKSVVVERPRAKFVGPHLTIPGTQQEGDSEDDDDSQDDSQDADEEQRSVTNGTIAVLVGDAPEEKPCVTTGLLAGCIGEPEAKDNETKVGTYEALVGAEPEEKPSVTTGLSAGRRAEVEATYTEPKVGTNEVLVGDAPEEKPMQTNGLIAGCPADPQGKGTEAKVVSDEALVVEDAVTKDRLAALSSLLAAANCVTGSRASVDRKRKHKGDKRASKLSLKKRSVLTTDGLITDDQPLALYNYGNKQLRKRLFPCPSCQQAADGSHQCGGCFKHVHVYCATPFKNAPEGFGQTLLCGLCVETNEDESATQFWVEDDTGQEEEVSENVALGGDVANAFEVEDEKKDPQKCLRAALTTFLKKYKAGQVGTKSDGGKRKRKAIAKFVKAYKLGTRVSQGSKKKSKRANTLNVEGSYNGAVTTSEVNGESAAKDTVTGTSGQCQDSDTHMANYDVKENESNGDAWEDDDYYWDAEYGTWVYMPQKRVRRRDLTNKKEKNWALGMRRNWNTQKHATMMESITIKRDKLDTVTL